MYGNYYLSDPDLMEDMKDLHVEGLKKNVYLLMTNTDMRGSTTKTDIEKHLASNSAIVIYDGAPSEDAHLYHGLLLDPASLPYEIADHIMKDRCFYLIIESGREIECEDYDSLEEVTETISHLMAMNEDLEITDFAVLLGSEIELILTPAKSGDMVPVYAVLGE